MSNLHLQTHHSQPVLIFCNNSMVFCIVLSQSHFRLRKRVFILGPSHHVYLSGCALSAMQVYETPLYNLDIDQDGRGTHST